MKRYILVKYKLKGTQEIRIDFTTVKLKDKTKSKKDFETFNKKEYESSFYKLLNQKIEVIDFYALSDKKFQVFRNLATSKQIFKIQLDKIFKISTNGNINVFEYCSGADVQALNILEKFKIVEIETVKINDRPTKKVYCLAELGIQFAAFCGVRFRQPCDVRFEVI